MKWLKLFGKIILSIFLWLIVLVLILPKFSDNPNTNLTIFVSLAVFLGMASLFLEAHLGKKKYLQKDTAYPDYLRVIWRSVYWSCIWYIGWSFFLIFLIPDHLLGNVLAIFPAFISGIVTAITKFRKTQKMQMV